MGNLGYELLLTSRGELEKNMKSFAEIYDRAAERKGGEDALNALIQVELKTPQELATIPNDRYLSAMTEAVFKAGFVWKVIENKWDGFEAAFWKFNINRCAYMSEDDIDQLAQDTRIVRNRQKIVSVPANAVMILEQAAEHGSFGKMIGDWPSDDFSGLLRFLSKHGSRLGGNSGQYVLRRMGKDGFVLGRDGVAALVDAGVIDKLPSSQTAMQKVQAAYNQWSHESGLALSQISRVLGYSINAV